MSYNLRDILWTIGGPESPAGTEVTPRTHVIPIRDNPGLTQRATRIPDPVIAGTRMKQKAYTSQLDVNGPLPLSPRVGGGFGKLLKSLCGTESTPAQIGACMRVRYTPGSASCKMVSDSAGKTLKSYIGVLGAESADGSFGTAGSIDLTNAAYDTVAELVAYIEGLAAYECQLVTGDGTTAVGSQLIISLTTQAANRWAYFFFTKTTGGAYLRTFTEDLTGTEHPTYSIEGEGYADQFLYCGCQVASMKFSAALGAMLQADVDILGFTELAGEAASGLTIANLDPGDPLIMQLGKTALAGKDYPYIESINWTIDNQHSKAGFGQGSLTRQYHRKGDLVITGDMQVVLDANSYALRADLLATTFRSLGLTFKGRLIANLVYEMLILELPYVLIQNPYDFTPRDGAFDAKINWEAFYQPGTVWDLPMKLHMISADSAAF